MTNEPGMSDFVRTVEADDSQQQSKREIALSLLISITIVAAGIIIFSYRSKIQVHFAAIATSFDRSGVLSNPGWLNRPIITLAGILICYGVVRLVFEWTAQQALERFVLVRTGPRLPRNLILLGSFVGMPVLFGFFVYALTHPRFWNRYYAEDQLFENATVGMLLLGGLLILVGAIKLRRTRIPFRKLGVAGLIMAGVATIWLALEEISYGQRIFGWVSPPAIKDTNLQSETNLHNYWTHDAQEAIIWLIAMTILAGLTTTTFLRRFWNNPWISFLPDQAFIVLATAILLLSTHAAFHEPLEQSVALFAMLYGIQLAFVSSCRMQ